MSYDPQKHAALLVDYCIQAQPGERILVATTTLALPLVEALHRQLLQRGARPLLRLEYPEQQQDFLRHASDELLDSLHPADLAEIESIQGSIRIQTPQPPVAGDPERATRHARSHAPIATARAQRKWTLTLYPTDFGAQAAGMSLPDYQDFVASAMFLDQPDSLAAWGEVRDRQARLIGRLQVADRVHILAPGTDLHLSVKGRRWANSDGRRNMPSGEVFTGPIEESVEGQIFYGLPTLFQGVQVSGIRLRFERGQVVEASAEEGGEALQAALATDPGARFVGELGIGTNFGIQRPSMNILFDEKMGGTVHLALGRSYPETGGLNRSALHWDMICDLRGGGEVRLDGEAFIQNGRFVL